MCIDQAREFAAWINRWVFEIVGEGYGAIGAKG
jgi:hypothetical protein